MAFTADEEVEFRDTFKAAYLAVASGKSYTIATGGTTRVLTRQDLTSVRDEYFFWQDKVEKRVNGRPAGMPQRFGTPLR